jgi:hypothetical protein
MSVNIDHARSLAYLMSAISERCYCAGWLIGTEHVLWDALSEPDWTELGTGRVCADEKAELRRLSGLAGAWVIYDHEAPDIGVVFEEYRAVPLDEWRKYHEEQRSQ